MKRVLPVAVALLSLCAFVTVTGQGNRNPAVRSFWNKFQSAVAKDDKEAVASMTKFPLNMPYGAGSIKTKAQLIRSYGKIFDAETKRCFTTAEPQVEGAASKKFSISCGEAMMYWFQSVNGGYKFAAVDNVNE